MKLLRRQLKFWKRFFDLVVFLYGRLICVIEDLAEHPFIGKQLKADLKGKWSVRVGNYRIIYKVARSKLTVQVIDVGHRKDIYKANKSIVLL